MYKENIIDKCVIYVNDKDKIILPKSLIASTVKWYHFCLGHPGINRTYNTIAAHFWCEGLISYYIKNFIKKCDGCLKEKRSQPKFGKLPPAFDTIYSPWQVIQVDLVGPWLFSDATGKDRNIHALSIIDPTTRWVELHLLKLYRGKTALNIAQTLENEWFCRYPRPSACIFDNGTEFGFKFLDLLISFGVEPKHRTIKNPQANSIVERAHQTIADSIRAQDLENKKITNVELKNIIQSTAFGLQSIYHSALKASPGQVTFEKDILINMTYVAN